MAARVLMVQGTASSVGKSLLVTALCRILLQDGVRVAPFKAQNMSNNSYVAANGGEIGRAQVNQAEAAGIEPETDMNPILLKPESDRRSQVVVDGRPYCTAGAGEYHKLKRELWPRVTSALDRLRDRFDAVLIEGAGSPAEINLRDSDIVNMRVARYVGAPVLLAGDIDRGGVFAHLVGTLELLQPEERLRMAGFIINKFRGDPALLEPGLHMLTDRTGLPVIGVVPYLEHAWIADEDSVALDDRRAISDGQIDVAVMRLPHISNFDDFDPLDREPDVALRYVTSGGQLHNPDLIVIPGSKATISDLAWLRKQGLDDEIRRAVAAGSALLGICGGYQMLCRRIDDPQQIESSSTAVDGLGLLAGTTTFAPSKTTERVKAKVLADRGLLSGLQGTAIEGYEIHMGQTCSDEPPAFAMERVAARPSPRAGSIGPDGWTLGCYLHGLFANDKLRRRMIENLAARRGLTLNGRHVEDKELAYDELAKQVRASLDMPLIHRLLDESINQPSLPDAAWER
jgi:adenosylcobyric acid synthase